MTAVPLLASEQRSVLAAEGYIFQQYAGKLHRRLETIIPEVLEMCESAGFRNVELNPSFFPPQSRGRTLDTIRRHNLHMPSVYVGGALHTTEAADRTIADALEYAELCRPFGCTAVVNNPDPKPHDERKTDAELATEAESLNRMGRTLAREGFELRVHHHTPQLEENGREWRFILQHTDPSVVFMCVDVDWAYEGGFQPLPFLKEVGSRLREIHVRSARNKVWLEDLEDSDIDYRAVAAYLRQTGLHPEIVVELAYRPQTTVTRSLTDDLRISRVYAERVFGVKADA